MLTALLPGEMTPSPARILQRTTIQGVEVLLLRVDFVEENYPFFYMVRSWDADLPAWAKLLLLQENQGKPCCVLPNSDGYGYLNDEQDALKELRLLEEHKKLPGWTKH